jgi:hypothetical protein
VSSQSSLKPASCPISLARHLSGRKNEREYA